VILVSHEGTSTRERCSDGLELKEILCNTTGWRQLRTQLQYRQEARRKQFRFAKNLPLIWLLSKVSYSSDLSRSGKYMHPSLRETITL